MTTSAPATRSAIHQTKQTKQTEQTEQIEAEICTLAGQIAAATSRFLRLLAEFDAREGWGGWQVRSCARWLSWRCGLDLRTAHEYVRVARALTGLPRIQESFDAGRLSYSKVRAITRVATPVSEPDLLDAALHAPAAHVERLVRGLRTATRDQKDPEAFGVVRDRARPAPGGPRVSWRWDENTGELLLSGCLPAEDGARLLAAITRAQSELDRTRQRSTEHAPAPAGPTQPAAPDGLARPAGHDRSAEHSPVTPGPGSASPDQAPPGSAPATPATPAGAAGQAADEHSAEHSPARRAEVIRARPPANLGPGLLAMADMICAGLPAPRHAPAAEVIITVDIDTFRAAFPQPAQPAQPEGHEKPAQYEEDREHAGPAEDAQHTEHTEPTPGAEPPGTAPGGTGPGMAPASSRPSRAARLDDGPPLTPTALRQLADDGRLRLELVAGDGRTLDLGRARRTPSSTQLNALWRRDRGCTVPGCDRTRFLHAHHVLFWIYGGLTTLDNLLLLCSEHHRALHHEAFTITALGQQRFQFALPDGTALAAAPPMTGSATRLTSEHPQISPTTIEPDWDGQALPAAAINTYLTTWQQTLQRTQNPPEAA